MQPNTREMQPSLSGAADEFFDQMLAGIPGNWPDLGNPKSPWDISSSGGASGAFDESSLLASRLRQHQISSPTGRPAMLQLNHRQNQQQMLLSAMAAGRSPASAGVGDLLPLPLSLSSGDAGLKSPSGTGGNGIYTGYQQSIANQQQFNHAQGGAMGTQNYVGGAGASQNPMNSGSTASASAGSGPGAAAPPRQRVRARRGQATDPHSIAERLRRERIAERMKALQELVPNANKTDKASMLDEIIDYVKFLQLQVKVLSMSRLGGAAAVAPLVSDMSTEGRGGANGAGGNDTLTVTEHQVAKLMEEDMGSAMQYLQGKGLCLMPISLASAISTATCRPSLNPSLISAQPQLPVLDATPSSPNMSVLTVQSNMVNGTAVDADISRSSGGKDSSIGANQ